MSRILVVDDDRLLAGQVAEMLQLEGHQVGLAPNGQEGLKLVGTLRPELVILDMNMPGLGGVGVLRGLRDAALDAPPAVIVFTARTNMGEFLEGLNVAAYLTKPCDSAQLLKAVNAALGIRRPPAAAAPLAGRCVLVVEADAAVGAGLSAAFAEAGCTAEAVTDGSLALDRALHAKPDLVAVNRILQGMNGDRLAEMLHDLPATRGIPVVLYDPIGRSVSPDKYVTGRTGIKAFVGSTDAKSVVDAAVRVLGRAAGQP